MKALWYCSPCTNLGFALVDPSINRVRIVAVDAPGDLAVRQAAQLLNMSPGTDANGCMQIIRGSSRFLIALRQEFNSRVEHTPLGLSKLFLSPRLNMMQKFAMFCIPSKSGPRLGHSAESEQRFHRAAIKAPALVSISDADQPHIEMQNRGIIASYEDLTA